MSSLSLLSFSMSFNSFFSYLKLIVRLLFITIRLGIEEFKELEGEDSKFILTNIKVIL